MRVAFFGTPLWAVPVLDALSRHHQVVLVVTQPDKPQGRGLKPAPSPVARYAEAHGLPLLKPNRLKGNREFLEAFKRAAPEVAVTAAYGKILPKRCWRSPPTAFSTSTPPSSPSTAGPPPCSGPSSAGRKRRGCPS